MEEGTVNVHGCAGVRQDGAVRSSWARAISAADKPTATDDKPGPLHLQYRPSARVSVDAGAIRVDDDDVTEGDTVAAESRKAFDPRAGRPSKHRFLSAPELHNSLRD